MTRGTYDRHYQRSKQSASPLPDMYGVPGLIDSNQDWMMIPYATCRHPLSASDFLRRVPVESENSASYLTANARFDIWCDSNPNHWYVDGASEDCSPRAHLPEAEAPQQPFDHMIRHAQSLEEHVHTRKLIIHIEQRSRVRSTWHCRNAISKHCEATQTLQTSTASLA